MFKGPSSIVVCLAAIIMTSCGQRVQTTEYELLNPVEIKQAIALIDSARLSLVGFEPKEPECHPEANPFGVPTQELFDSAAVTWNTFVKLCQEDKFKEAYDLYNRDGKPGDFMVCLKNSTNLYCFYKDVLRPMMYEFEPKDSADVKYLSLLRFEYAIQDIVMKYSAKRTAGDTVIISQIFPELSRELGMMLAGRGQIDEALEMVESYAYSVYKIFGSPSFTSFTVALYIANLYYAAGDIAQAIETLENYKEYTAEHKDPDRDQEEYESYCSFVDGMIERMCGRQDSIN